MENLEGKKINEGNLLDSFIRIVDVINYEGPLLTLYRKIENDGLYLFDWVDRSNDYNRWLIYRTTPKLIDKFVKKEISHYELFLSADTKCVKIDIDRDIKWRFPIEFEKRNAPIGYFPSKDVYFEECDCPQFEKLKKVIGGAMNNVEQNNLVLYSGLRYSNTIPNNRVTQNIPSHKLNQLNVSHSDTFRLGKNY